MLEHNKNAFSPLKLRKHFNVVSDVAKPSLSRNMKEESFSNTGRVHSPATLEAPPGGGQPGGFGGKRFCRSSGSQVVKMKAHGASHELALQPHFLPEILFLRQMKGISSPQVHSATSCLCAFVRVVLCLVFVFPLLIHVRVEFRSSLQMLSPEDVQSSSEPSVLSSLYAPITC